EGDFGVFLDGFDESLFAEGGAFGAGDAADDGDFSTAVTQELEHFLAGHLSAFFVIGGDVGGVILRIDARVEDDDGDLLVGGGDGADQGVLVVGGDAQGVNALADHVGDNADLGLAVGFGVGAIPADVRVGFLAALKRAGLDRVPVGVVGALGDDGDGQLVSRPAGRICRSGGGLVGL